MEILDKIPFQIDEEKLLKKLRIAKSSDYYSEISRLIEKVAPVVRPKVVFSVSYIEEKNADSIVLDGVRFTSRVLSANVEKVERVFPFVATCGAEMEEFEKSCDDMLEIFWIDTIKYFALETSSQFLKNHLKEKFALTKISSMSPGSGKADTWPIEQQKQLFSLFGDVESLIGVRLTDSCLMIPNKSVSGIYFPRDVTFENCQLCPREGCPGRRAAYDESLLHSYFDEVTK